MIGKKLYDNQFIRNQPVNTFQIINDVYPDIANLNQLSQAKQHQSIEK
jgi:hypothetical protein